MMKDKPDDYEFEIRVNGTRIETLTNFKIKVLSYSIKVTRDSLDDCPDHNNSNILKWISKTKLSD